MIECEMQQWKIREELAKARARVSAYDELQPADLEEAIIHIPFLNNQVAKVLTLKLV